MANPKVGGIRTMGSREAAEAEVEPDLSVSAQLNAKFKYVYQSRKSQFVLSLERRRIHFMPDGTKEEEVPTSKEGVRLDMIRFTDHFYRTNDDEIDAALSKKPSHVFGTDGLCWRFADKQNEMRAARVAEIRAALASDPAIAKEVALTPSDKKDWDVSEKVVEKPNRVQKSGLDMTDEELEAATAPTPGSRNR